MQQQRHPEHVLNIFQTHKTKKRLIIDIGSKVFRVLNSSPMCYSIDQIADIHVGDKAGSSVVTQTSQQTWGETRSKMLALTPGPGGGPT